MSNDSANMISYLSVIHFDALSQSENNLLKKIKLKKPSFIMVYEIKKRPKCCAWFFLFSQCFNVNFYICRRNLVFLLAYMIANVTRNVMM